MMTKTIFNAFALAASIMASTTMTTNARLLAPHDPHHGPDDHHTSGGAGRDPSGAVNMLLEVTNVMPRTPNSEEDTVYDPNDSCMNYYKVKANIHHPPSGLAGPASLSFDSWYYDYSDPACTLVGPSSPPIIQPGWCGYVTLNYPDNESGDDFIAKDGDSFNKQPAGMCSS